MANSKVALVRLCKLDNNKWRYYPVPTKGRVKQGAVLVGKELKVFKEGCYRFRLYVGRKIVYRPMPPHLSDNIEDALIERTRLEHELAAFNHALAAGLPLPDTEARVRMEEQVDGFLERFIGRGQKAALKNSRVAIQDFLELTQVRFGTEVTPNTLFKFYAQLRSIRKNSDRTIHNKHVSLMPFLVGCGVSEKVTEMPPPKYVKQDPVKYDDSKLHALYAAAERAPARLRPDYLKVMLDVFYMGGIRLQEAMFLEWGDIDFNDKILFVRQKIKGGSEFRPKGRKERMIGIPDELIASLVAWRKHNPHTRLVLGTKNDTPNDKMLRTLKRLVKIAGLNCGTCDGCLKFGECYDWKIKTFRSTYSTKITSDGMDPRTAMDQTGHQNIETLEKYLASKRAVERQKQVSGFDWKPWEAS